MKTSMLLAIFAIGGVVAFAGVATAAGTDMGILNTRDGDGSGNGMMARGGGCHGSGGQSAQYQYQGECPGTCDNYYNWNYSWDWDHNYCGQ